jgi:hypothetical protein
MKRSLWLIFAALILIAAGILLQYQPDKLAMAAPAEPGPLDVRIQHEFVRVPPAGIASSTPQPDRRAAQLEEPTSIQGDPDISEPPIATAAVRRDAADVSRRAVVPAPSAAAGVARAPCSNEPAAPSSAMAATAPNRSQE